MEPTPDINIQIKVNNEQRVPCVIVIDASTSMNGPITDGKSPIMEVNEGLAILEAELKSDGRTKDKAQLLVIRAGGDVSVVSDWTDVRYFSSPTLVAHGGTPLGEAMSLALSKIEEIKKLIKDNSGTYTRPWLFLLTDGEPTDDWERAAELCRRAEIDRKVVVYPFGTEGANFAKLKQFTNEDCFKLKGAAFAKLFKFLSQSIGVAAERGKDNTAQMQLPPEIVVMRS